MRCLIVIALCFVLANASYPTKNRFQRLLNQYQDQDRYQNQHRNRYQSQDRMGNEPYGSDDTDDYIDDYVREIRRERRLERDQCPRDIDEIEGQFQDEGQYDDEEEQGNRRGRYNQEYESEFEHEGRRGGRGEFEREGRRGGQYSQYEDEEEQQSRIRGSPLLREVEEANVRLAARLYKQSRDEKDDKNTVVSPLSVQLALAALNAGARGNTQQQIGRVIGGRLQKQQRIQIIKQVVRHLKGLRQNEQNEYSSRQQQQTKINAVTGIFVTQTTRAQHMFVQQIKRNLGANLHQCNFQRQPQQCRQQINRFVAQKTHGKINHIVPQDAITDNTKMILVNAMQLKAPFGRQVRQHLNTKGAKFYPLDTKKVKHVEVIETQGRFKYYEDELVKIVGLPTEKKQLTLYVIVPKDKDGLTDVEKLHLQDGQQLKQLLDVTDQRTRHVGVQLPKFQIKHKIDVRRTLRKQGVTDAFDVQRADFSGITGSQQGQQGQQQYNQYEDEEESSQNERYQSRQRRNPFLNYEQDETMEYSGRQEQEHKLHLNKFIHQTTIKITEQGITCGSGSQSPFENDDEQTEGQQFGQGRQGRRHHRGEYENEQEQGQGQEEYNTFDEVTGFNRREQSGQGQNKMVKANRAFAFVVKHNPTNQVVMIGRVIDAAQKKVNEVHQTINNVDQL